MACPVALHPDGVPLRLPVFEHPKGGFQIVKGGIKEGERPKRAAARELIEESGLQTRSALLLGTSEEIVSGERWHFALCRVAPPVRDRWQHLCADDGGLLLRFDWGPLDDARLEGRFARAAAWIAAAL
ncbi:MAG: NUDIX domain-containing protein [Pseudomonadota bacterium]